MIQVHFHRARRGVNGPVVAFISGFHDRGWDADGAWIDHEPLTTANIIREATLTPPACPRAIDDLAGLRRATLDGPIHVNAHTVANPAGEVWGQVVRVDRRCAKQGLGGARQALAPWPGVRPRRRGRG
jgi:hypothetical protein